MGDDESDSVEQYLELIENAEEGDVVIFDEAGGDVRRLGKADKGLREAAKNLDRDE